MQPSNARFGGELAPILFFTLHPSAFFLGSVCGGLVFGLVMLMGWLEMSRVAPVILQALIFLFVIRIAMNSAYGPSAMGGFFRATGSDWPGVLSALGRLVLLNLIWAVPMAIMSTAVAKAPSELLTGAGLGAPAMLLMLALVLLPPLFLVSSVAAQTIGDLFDSQHWKAVFGGRWPDVVALFIVYVGGVLSATGISFMIGGSLGSGKAGLTLFCMLVAGAYSGGIYLLLLGRLVGGFLRTAGGEPVSEAAYDMPDFDAHAPVDETYDDDDSGDDYDFESIADEQAQRDGQGKFYDISSREHPPVRPAPATGPVSGTVAAIVRGEASATETGELSLGENLRRLQRMAEADPEVALAELGKLVSEQGPHPTVLGRMAILQKTLEPEAALATARQAGALAVKVGNIGVLGELYEVFAERMNELGVPPELWQKVAAGQQSMGRIELATELYGKVLGLDPTNVAAIKGLIQIADGHLKSDEGAEDALAIYEGLETMCPDHPFVEFVERGRESAERRLARVR